MFISRLHYITQDLPNLSHTQLAQMACRAGADWVQLRLKNKLHHECLQIAQEVKTICHAHQAKLIINDDVWLAKEIKADGVHLGKNDMNPLEARMILGEDCIIGGSTNTAEDIERQIANRCNYIGLGPFKHTTTKEKLNPVLGLAGIKKIAQRYAHQLPILAIGGIQEEDVPELLKTGLHGIAIASTINRSPNPESSFKKIIHLITQALE